jgi:FtsP/CotA-like multicopper oxidase with cupredoxin domain
MRVVLFGLRSRAQGILINNQFPGPQIDAVTNDNLVVNVYNKLTEPFLLSWLVVLLYLHHGWHLVRSKPSPTHRSARSFNSHGRSVTAH